VAQARFDVIAPHLPAQDVVRLEFMAEVAAWHNVDSLAAVEHLRGQHIWRDEVIAERFDWGRTRNLFALALRVFRLPQAVELPMQPAYGGCKSWIELAEEVATEGAAPVLNDAAFAARRKAFDAALAPGAATTAV
jgi:hypothetical protein